MNWCGDEINGWDTSKKKVWLGLLIEGGRIPWEKEREEDFFKLGHLMMILEL